MFHYKKLDYIVSCEGREMLSPWVMDDTSHACPDTDNIFYFSFKNDIDEVMITIL